MSCARHITGPTDVMTVAAAYTFAPPTTPTAAADTIAPPAPTPTATATASATSSCARTEILHSSNRDRGQVASVVIRPVVALGSLEIQGLLNLLYQLRA